MFGARKFAKTRDFTGGLTAVLHTVAKFIAPVSGFFHTPQNAPRGDAAHRRSDHREPPLRRTDPVSKNGSRNERRAGPVRVMARARRYRRRSPRPPSPGVALHGDLGNRVVFRPRRSIRAWPRPAADGAAPNGPLSVERWGRRGPPARRVPAGHAQAGVLGNHLRAGSRWPAPPSWRPDYVAVGGDQRGLPQGN